LKTWLLAKNIFGVLVIFAVISTIVSAIAALMNERDTSSAMKLPAALAALSVVAFVHAQKKLLPAKAPNQSPQPPPEGRLISKVSQMKALSIPVCMLLAACSTVPPSKSQTSPLNLASPLQPAAGERYQEEKAALDRAAVTGTVAAYDQFLAKYPESSWKPTAIYQRDGLALEEAKRSGTPEAFRDFLRRYPASQWAEQARYYLQYGAPGAPK
jgi:TolA-binding protein